MIVDVAAGGKNAALRDLAGRAAALLNEDVKVLFKALQDREKLGSTGMGDGVAIPHVRVMGTDQPIGILVRLKNPIDFDAVDGRPVDILFFLALPQMPKGGVQLNVLACAARRLRDEVTIAEIRKAPDASRAYRAILGS
ncbi:PTS sugar transporter subunit IIA [Microvirga sp. BT291]|nr:PTS sugar transporter subunit IIA [Microvirga pudoricolor]